MRIATAISLTMTAIFRHPIRSILVSSTFALGFASVLSIIATIEGGQRSVTHDLQALGTDLVACLNPIEVGPLPPLGTVEKGFRPIDVGDFDALQAEFSSTVEAVIPFSVDLVVTRIGEIAMTHTLISTEPAFEKVVRSGILAGRFLEEQDFSLPLAGSPIPAAIDEALALRFTDDPGSLVGTRINTMRGGKPVEIEIIGVLADPITLRKHLQIFDGSSRARTIAARRLEFLNLYLPFQKTADRCAGILVDAGEPADIDHLMPRLKAFFQSRGVDPYYHIQKLWVQQVLEMASRLSRVGHFLWIVDLLVVLVLVGSISLLAVDETFFEVALRRAEGATVLQVVAPVLLEGVLLAAAGIVPGALLASVILREGIQPVLLWQPYLPPLAVWGTPVLLLLTALVSYAIPARKVARLQPAGVLSGHRD